MSGDLIVLFDIRNLGEHGARARNLFLVFSFVGARDDGFKESDWRPWLFVGLFFF